MRKKKIKSLAKLPALNYPIKSSQEPAVPAGTPLAAWDGAAGSIRGREKRNPCRTVSPLPAELFLRGNDSPGGCLPGARPSTVCKKGTPSKIKEKRLRFLTLCKA